MARVARESMLLPREGNFFNLHPPPGQEVPSVDELGHQGSALARQDFWTFFGPRPKVFEKHWLTSLQTVAYR